MDGTKLPLFCIFKGKKDGKIQRTLETITPAGIVRAVDECAWMEADMMHVWVGKLWKPYASECNEESMLLFDDHTSQKTA